MFEIHYCSENELVAKRFLHKFHEFTKNIYDVSIEWVTRKVKSLFSLKDKTRTPLVLFTREFATAGKTTSERLLETRQLDEMSMKTLKKIITSDKRGSKGAARAAKSLRWSV